MGVCQNNNQSANEGELPQSHQSIPQQPPNQQQKLNAHPQQKKQKGAKPKSSFAKRVYKHKQLTQQAKASLKLIQHKIPKSDEPIYEVTERGVSYQGPFKGYLPNGEGICYFEKGEVYIGEFVDGEAESERGYYVFFDGSIYEGNFKNSMFNGYGSLRYETNKLEYSGNWKNGVPEGYGEERYLDGAKYEGRFENGKWEGKGEYTWPNGMKYVGQFKKGTMDGMATVFNKDGKLVYTGSYQDNKKSGLGFFKTSIGTYYGIFENDQFNGNGTFVWEDKKKAYEGQFNKNKMEGRGKMYYETSQIIEGEWQKNHNIKILKEENDEEALQKLQALIKQHEEAGKIEEQMIDYN